MCNYRKSGFNLIFILSLVINFSESKYAFLETCSRNDPNLNACILEKAAIVAPRILKGVPELKIPRLDPLYIESVTLQAARDLQITAKDIYVYGLNTYKYLDVKTNLEKQESTSHFQFDNITLIGEYNIDGKLSVLDLSGISGPIIATLENVDLNVTIQWDFYKKKDVLYTNITNVDFEHDVRNVHINLENIFGRNERLSKEINTLINENWHKLAKDFDAGIRQAIAIILERVNAIVKYIPFDELFPDI